MREVRYLDGKHERRVFSEQIIMQFCSLVSAHIFILSSCVAITSHRLVILLLLPLLILKTDLFLLFSQKKV